jgi:thiol-disulfide isomerase/thioredoxin
VGFAVIGVVVVIIVALVIVKVTGGSTSPKKTHRTTQDISAPASLIAEVTSVPSSVAQAVGLPSSVNPPSVLKGEPPLILDGKPGAVFIGAEFCPYCAAERWAVVMAFSKFGTFSGLKETASSAWDYAASTATFSFYGASYLSNLLTFEPVEAMGNDTSAVDTHQLLQKLSSTQSNLWATYSARFGTPEGFPFLDVGNKVFGVGLSYDPKILSGLTQSAIAAKLKNPSDPVTQAIVGSANYLTAAICSITNQQPASVCSAAGTAAAAKALGTG